MAEQIINIHDKRYEKTEFQEFSNISEAIKFLGDYCGKCIYNKCVTQRHLRSAMGENYPFWSNNFIKRELKFKYSQEPWGPYSEKKSGLQGIIISCKKFKENKK